MPAWVPDDRDALGALGADLASMFTQAEDRLRRDLTKTLTAELRDRGELNLAGLARARRLARQLVAQLQAAAPEKIQSVLDTAAQQGALAAVDELSPLGVATSALPGAGAAAALVADLTNAVDTVTSRILRWPDDVWRRTIAQSSTDVVLGLGTTRTAQARAWQQLLAKGVGGIVDKAGRRWNLATYVEMATRTATRRAWEAQHTTTMLAHGINLVSIVVGNGACERCARWAGKILRLNPGPTGTLHVPNAVGDGDVTVDVAATVDEAKEQGWQHPNCRCRPAVYLPGLSVVADATTYDPEAEADQTQQRALERDVRAAKAERAAAVTPEQQKAADKKVRDAQTAAREHAADTSVQRRMNREQLDLGHQAAPDGPTMTKQDPLPSTARTTRSPAPSESDRTHVIETHGPGTGIPKKSEFPAGWNTDRMMSAVRTVQTSPSSHVRRSGDKTIVEGLVDGIWVRVLERTMEDGTRIFWTGYPIKGPGVRFNRADSKKSWMLMDSSDERG